MNITYAQEKHLEELQKLDKHVTAEVLLQKITNEEILLLLTDEGLISGFLRFNYFWDSIPFMNMLQVKRAFQKKGLGRKLVTEWEQEMKVKGYQLVMTSTQSDEEAQHFYRKLNYKDQGSLILSKEPLEIIFVKEF
jgi:ribosomal protein S18 acetylase RimI-like enzyme